MDGETDVSGKVIQAALEVHRELGPGLLESVYRACLIHELEVRGMQFEKEAWLPVVYRGAPLDCGFRLDLLVEGRLIVELKAVNSFHDLHTAQLLTYMKLSQIPLGLLINFNTPLLKQGIRRMILSE